VYPGGHPPEPGFWPSRGRGADALSGPAAGGARAVIGDELRIPSVWCEMTPCISRHADPAALGEADVRARAIGAGWREDAFGRLACPGCQQRDPRFRPTGQVMRWDREFAVAMTTLLTLRRNGQVRPGAPPPR
jgi:hypothetical protein